MTDRMTSSAGDRPEATAAAGPSPAAPGNPPGAQPAPDSGAAGPVSILTCASCGKPNRIRPSEKGAPHCGSCGKPLPWIVPATDATFEQEARASVAVLVDLWAAWCAPCRMVAPILQQLATEFAGRIKVVKVDVDANPRLAQTFGASSIPMLIVLQNGRVVDRMVGVQPLGDLRIRLTPYLLRR